MHKLNKMALVVSTIVSAQAFAAEADKFGVEVYGKAGMTSGEADNGVYGDRVEDGFGFYEDSKVGIIADYKFNKYLSVHGEVKSDFQGQELDLRIQEALIRGQIEKVNFEIGRMRTPLYMNSETQDMDYNRKTYDTARFFDTDRLNIETIEGLGVGYEHDFSFGHAEFNALAGVVLEHDIKTYDSLTDKHNKEVNDADFVYQGEALLGTKFGKFRAAYLEAKDTTVKKDGVKSMPEDFDSFSLGYSFDSGALFADAEMALENEGLSSTDKYYATIGYQIHGITPYVTYGVSTTNDGVSDVDVDSKSMVIGATYKINRYVSVGGAFENLDNDTTDENLFSLGLAAKF